MSDHYQSKGFQLSFLIHAAVFLLISRMGISESRFSPPAVIDLGIISEVVEEPAPRPLPEEKQAEEPPKIEEMPPPQTKIEPVRKKEPLVRAAAYREIPKKIAPAKKKETPPVKPEKITEQPAAPSSDPSPASPADDNSMVSSAFSENSGVAAPAPTGNSGGASEGGGVEGGSGTSKTGSIFGSENGTSDNLIFGTAAGPKYRHKEMPVYPSRARRLGKEGKVLLRLTIDENGNLVDIEVIEDSGYGFAEAAIAAVKKSSFVPPTMNGRPIRARALLPVEFILR